MRKPLLVLMLASVAALHAQVSMPVNPVLGSPTNLTINWNSSQTTGALVLIMHANPGQVQGSCYLSLTRDSTGVWASLYQTTTSTPDQSYSGLLGPGGPWWATTIYSNACEINLPIAWSLPPV